MLIRKFKLGSWNDTFHMMSSDWVFIRLEDNDIVVYGSVIEKMKPVKYVSFNIYDVDCCKVSEILDKVKGMLNRIRDRDREEWEDDFTWREYTDQEIMERTSIEMERDFVSHPNMVVIFDNHRDVNPAK